MTEDQLNEGLRLKRKIDHLDEWVGGLKESYDVVQKNLKNGNAEPVRIMIMDNYANISPEYALEVLDKVLREHEAEQAQLVKELEEL